MYNSSATNTDNIEKANKAGHNEYTGWRIIRQQENNSMCKI